MTFTRTNKLQTTNKETFDHRIFKSCTELLTQFSEGFNIGVPGTINQIHLQMTTINKRQTLQKEMGVESSLALMNSKTLIGLEQINISIQTLKWQAPLT